MENLENEMPVVENPYPGVSQRIIAMCLDGAVLLILLMGFSYIFSLFNDPPVYAKMFAFLFCVLLYDPLFTTLFGGTIGHMMQGIRVKKQSNETENIIFQKALLRYVIKAFLGWVSLLVVYRNDRRKAIHDYAAGSVVIYKKLLLLLLLYFSFAGVTYAQDKSVAVIIDIEDSLYLVKVGFMDYCKITRYDCNCNQSAAASEYMLELLNKNYNAEIIDLPNEYRESRGILTKSSRKWIKSLSEKYDAIIYLYTRTKDNAGLFRYSDYPLYSSGLVYLVRDEKSSQVYTSITARAFSTKDGLPFYHLDNFTDNATLEQLKKIIPLNTINDSFVCETVKGIINALMKYRYNEFMEGFDYLMSQE